MAWEVQQAYDLRHVELPENEWFALSQKMNGVRGTIFEGKMISRQGKEIAGLDHILADMRKLIPGLDGFVFDGELVRKNPDHLSDNANFRVGSGIINSKDADKSCIMFVIFDFLSKEQFLEGESRLSYKDRLDMLHQLKELICKAGLKNVRTVPTYYEGRDQDQIAVYLDRMVEMGKEGLMLNRDTPYFRKRHAGILKVKVFRTIDLEVVGFEEGKGRCTGMLGAFVCLYDFDVLPWEEAGTVNVGTGMTDSQRIEFWNIRDQLIGRVVEVMYKEETEDKQTGLRSLQFPVFVSLREEGKAVSYE